MTGVFPVKISRAGKIKTRFSEKLERVRLGESFGVVYGNKKRHVARIRSVYGPGKKVPRKIGVLNGKNSIVFAEDFKMTESELMGFK